jgi:KipI family sensor histidine kinase inhibitor
MGDEAVLLDVEGGYRAARSLALSLRARDVVPGAETVGVIGPFESVEPVVPERGPVTHDVPVVLDGPDLAEVGLSTDEAARLLAGSSLEVAWLGFMPGFAYLVGLPPELAALPRRAVPRTRVPAGSLAVGGGYAGIYPRRSPGGWNLLGRTGFRAFEISPEPRSVLQPGDRVRLVPVPDGSLEAVDDPPRPLLSGEALEVLDPGPLLLVEDGGRVGAGHLGVPRAGAANPAFLRIANMAVGNDEWAPALELAGGVRLQARRDVLLALAGDAVLTVGDTALPPGTVASAGRGQTIAVGPVLGRARAVLAVAGGIRIRPLFGSCSSDPVSGLPPGPLRPGDVLDLGAAPARARLRFSLPESRHGHGGAVPLRAVVGPDEGPAGALEALVAGRAVVDPRSDRTGLRLRRTAEASPDLASALTPVPSHAVVPGCIQVPPGGELVVLGPDCGPVGGYPVLATVITADLWRLGTLVAGDDVEITFVSLDYAARCRERLDTWIAEAVTGWYPTAFA